MNDIKTIFFTIINDCQRFWDNYYHNGVIAGAVTVSLYCTILYYGKLRQRKSCVRNRNKNRFGRACAKLPFVALLGFYGYLILGVTVLSRNQEAAYILRPVPFSTWGTDIASLTFWIENILMMIPLSILLYILWTPFRRLYWSLFTGFLCSLTIECVQLFTRLGKFETDDIMNNMAGMVIGFGICKGIGWVVDRSNMRSRHKWTV